MFGQKKRLREEAKALERFQAMAQKMESIWPPIGEIEVKPIWADNQIGYLSVRFALTPDEWSEFQTTPDHQSLAERIQRSALKIQDTNRSPHEQECKEGIDPYVENPNPKDVL